MSERKIGISLAFSADTSQAQTQLKTLETSLREIQKISSQGYGSFNSADMRKASQAAAELERHMANAMNPKTGNIDLTRLNSSLKSSGRTLDSYMQQIKLAGRSGEEAFNQISRAVLNAEAPTTRLTARMNGFLTTLKNTAK